LIFTFCPSIKLQYFQQAVSRMFYWRIKKTVFVALSTYIYFK